MFIKGALLIFTVSIDSPIFSAEEDVVDLSDVYWLNSTRNIEIKH